MDSYVIELNRIHIRILCPETVGLVIFFPKFEDSHSAIHFPESPVEQITSFAFAILASRIKTSDKLAFEKDVEVFLTPQQDQELNEVQSCHIVEMLDVAEPQYAVAGTNEKHPKTGQTNESEQPERGSTES